MKKIKTLLIVLALAIIPLTYGASKNKIRFHDAEFEKLVSEQKFKEASNRLKFLIDQSQKNNDEFLWANLIAKETLLKIGMHGYETAVIDLKKQPQPKNSLAKAVINITLAYSFKTYFDSYSYEIRKREFVSEKNNFDIKKLTTEEIFNESLKAFNLAWNIRQDDQLSLKMCTKSMLISQNFLERLLPRLQLAAKEILTKKIQVTIIISLLY